MVGLPLIFSCALLMLISVRALRDSDPGFARWENNPTGLISAGQEMGTTVTLPANLRPVHNGFSASMAAPAAVVYAPRAVPITVAATMSPLEAQYNALEALRETTHTTERSYRASIGEPTNAPPKKGGGTEIMYAH